ncbi:MAG: hypothetical protein RL391_1363 [Actinomycetota bacterium]|jgi:DNA-binding IclR family transcriptional regulator
MDSVSGIGVLDKVALILDALEESSSASLGDLVDSTGIPRATLHRLAVAMEQHGMVRRDSDGRFRLGGRFVALGRAAGAAYPFVESARSILDRLRTSTGESVQLYVREGSARRCVVSFESTHGLRWIVPEGALLPLSAGSAGHVLAGEPVGRDGWLQSVGEREVGVASVSAPILDADGAVVAAISVSGPIERLTAKPGQRYGADLVKAARRIERVIS